MPGISATWKTLSCTLDPEISSTVHRGEKPTGRPPSNITPLVSVCTTHTETVISLPPKPRAPPDLADAQPDSDAAHFQHSLTSHNNRHYASNLKIRFSGLPTNLYDLCLSFPSKVSPCTLPFQSTFPSRLAFPFLCRYRTIPIFYLQAPSSGAFLCDATTRALGKSAPTTSLLAWAATTPWPTTLLITQIFTTTRTRRRHLPRLFPFQ